MKAKIEVDKNGRSTRVVPRSPVQYRVKEDAPMHYIDGLGRVKPGTLITLREGVKPGKWLERADGQPIEEPKAEKSAKAPKAAEPDKPATTF